MADKEKSLSVLVKTNGDIKRRFSDVLGKKAPAFLSSVVSATSSNSMLQQCDPVSVLGAAMIAATLDLPINPNLGFAAIVPYRKGTDVKAQFQMMYKGYIQLAIRSGQYTDINVAEVYADELVNYNPHTGKIVFTTQDKWKMRDTGKPSDIVGYFATFSLSSGFEKQIYRSKKEILAHGKKYSQSFKKGQGLWEDNFDAMAKKTILKELLSKWGILSTEIQTAIEADFGSTSFGNESVIDYLDNQPEEESSDPKEVAPEIFGEGVVVEEENVNVSE